MTWLVVSDMVFSGVMTMYVLSRLFSKNMHLADPLEEIISANLKSNGNYVGSQMKIVATRITNVVPLKQFDAIKILSSLINKLIGESVALCVANLCLYMSVDMDQLFLERGKGPKYYSEVALWAIYNVIHIPTVILSAEICRQVILMYLYYFKTAFRYL